MNIIQITPKLPPAIDGVGDYSLKLADELLKNYGILTHFLTCQRGFEPAPVINGFPVVELPAQNTTAFLDSLPKNIYKIILHYSDFPYDQKYGSPFWLLDALAAVKRQQQFKLLVMFHEFPYLYLLKKIFYLFPFQSFVAWRVAGMADILFTNNSVSKTTLTSRLSQPVTNIPVFSNIGEPDHVPLLEKRTRRIVVFGTRGRRARIYQRTMSMLVNACRLLEVEEIYDVGPSLNLNVSKIKGIPLFEIGEKSAQDVSELMLDSLAGIAYSNDNRKLTKSGVFATYCAHGLVPIITQAKSSPADMIEVGTQFLFPDAQAKNLDLKSLQVIADNAHKWYKSHSQSKTAAIFASQLLD
jgi:hypothetical protein